MRQCVETVPATDPDRPTKGVDCTARTPASSTTSKAGLAQENGALPNILDDDLRVSLEGRPARGLSVTDTLEEFQKGFAESSVCLDLQGACRRIEELDSAHVRAHDAHGAIYDGLQHRIAVSSQKIRILTSDAFNRRCEALPHLMGHHQGIIKFRNVYLEGLPYISII